MESRQPGYGRRLVSHSLYVTRLRAVLVGAHTNFVAFAKDLDLSRPIWLLIRRLDNQVADFQPNAGRITDQENLAELQEQRFGYILVGQWLGIRRYVSGPLLAERQQKRPLWELTTMAALYTVVYSRQ